MNIREAHFNETNRCRVVAGPAGRTYFTTPQALGLALLGMPAVAETAAIGAGIVWHDYLATHGVAIGSRGDRQMHLAIIPPKMRTVSCVTRHDDGQSRTTSLNVTFPPVLASLLLHRGVYERGQIFLVDTTRQEQLSTGGAAPLLMTFPFGNVHAGIGHICWGGVRANDIRSIQDLDTLFFGSGFNHDLFDPTGANAASLRAAVQAAPNGVLPIPATARFTIAMTSAVGSLVSA